MSSTHSLALHCSPLPAQDVLELSEVLDKRHHLGLETLGMNILYRGHLQGYLDVTFPLQERIRLAISGWTITDMRLIHQVCMLKQCGNNFLLKKFAMHT